MPPESPAPSAAVLSVLELISAKLDAIEAELKRLGWWHAAPPDLQAEVAAGRLKSWLDAPTFELWLQCIFIPNARDRVKECDLPAGSSVGEMARRQYDYHSHVPEAAALLALLWEFDCLITAHNNMKQATAPEQGAGLKALTPAPELPADRVRLSATNAPALSFEDTLLAKRRGLSGILSEIEHELTNLSAGAAAADSAERWLTDGFVPEVRQWLQRGQVPQESRVAASSEQEWTQRGVLPQMAHLLNRLSSFDARVADYHTLSAALERDSAAGRILAAWRCIMAEPEELQNPCGPVPDNVRRQMLLTLNRIEAELKLTGWWPEEPPDIPEESRRSLQYWEGNPDRSLLPPWPLWLQSVFLPGLRACVQTAKFPALRRTQDDANRALSEERLGPAKFAETRRIYRAVGEMETLLERAWPAALRCHQNISRRRGLSGPASADAQKAAKESAQFRELLQEAAEHSLTALQDPLWQGNTRPGAADSRFFEHWLRGKYLPHVLARLQNGDLPDERRVSDYAAWECRLLGLTETAAPLLVPLEKVDHWLSLTNRARRDQWEAE